MSHKSEGFKLVISDCHLSAGRYFKGRLNPHEDFFFDDQMVEFFDYFSTGQYGEGSTGPVPVELFINGDFLDFLNVPYLGEFEEGITEEIALSKLEMVIQGHPKVMAALKRFASKPNKSITYLIGNHDAELMFEKVRERITREWDPDKAYPSTKVRVIGTSDRVEYPECGLEIRHGNQFEAGNQLDFEFPTLRLRNGVEVLNIPWGSIYILKIVNRLKWERSSLDKIRPIKVFVLFGIFLDTWFTLRFVLLSLFYFFKTRIFSRSTSLFGIRNTLKLVQQESKSFLDLENEAREVLNEKEGVHTIVFGHTHLPMHRVYPDGKQYLNSGTWTRMVYLDPRHFGEQNGRTFVLIRIDQHNIHAELNIWQGLRGPFQPFVG